MPLRLIFPNAAIFLFYLFFLIYFFISAKIAYKNTNKKIIKVIITEENALNANF